MKTRKLAAITHATASVHLASRRDRRAAGRAQTRAARRTRPLGQRRSVRGTTFRPILCCCRRRVTDPGCPLHTVYAHLATENDRRRTIRRGDRIHETIGVVNTAAAVEGA